MSVESWCLASNTATGPRSRAPRGRGWHGAGADLLRDDPILVPIPLHPLRLASRRYNQSAQLAWSMAAVTRSDVAVRALVRSRSTPSQDRRDRFARFENLSDAIHPHGRFATAIRGRSVLLIDDVMTSGATFAACGRGMFGGPAAEHVRVIALARVGMDA